MEFQKIYIVGAGPGDPDLLTVKAYRVIEAADVVLYDTLMGKEILSLVSPDAISINVGKTFQDNQDQSERQQRINSLMLEHYNRGHKVVRLKTGDPLVFGRGIEEIRFMQQNGIKYELIPGITAGLAAANRFQIPVTERSINRSLMFCTGTTIDNDLTQFEGVANMIRLGTPVVIYMGLHNIEGIIEKLIAHGVASSTTISAVSKVSHANESMLSGVLSNFVDLLKRKPLDMPTVIIIGTNSTPMISEYL